MMYLIERSEYYDDDVVTDRKVKLLNMLLIEKGQSVEDVAKDVVDRKMLLIERSKC